MTVLSISTLASIGTIGLSYRRAGDGMLDRVWIPLLSTAILLGCVGCNAPAGKPASTSGVTSEKALQVPGTYAAPEIDRGGPETPKAREDVLAGLPMGRVLFACPPTMRVQTSERVEVRISGDPKEDITSGLQERGVPIEAGAKIAPVMKVTLTPDEDGVFDMKALSEAEQLTGGTFSQWVWSVTPLKSGTHKLYLTVNVVVDVPGLGPQKREIPVLTQAVQVRTDVTYSTGEFWRKNWQWFTTTLLIPLGLWLWKKRNKAKE
jgi:hypothetical protein